MGAFMSDENRQAHWDEVYTSKSENAVSWFQESPALSLELIKLAGATSASAIVDIGGGASRVVDGLIANGFEHATVIDLSEAALASAKKRLGPNARHIKWVTADVTKWEPSEDYDIWHDRAAFHFLTEGADRIAYTRRLKTALRSGGHFIIGTFALDGPERCSGLPVIRYDAAGLSAEIGPEFELIATRPHEHITPRGATQRFQFSAFRRT
jgi:SAM-dependent methyltransferase